MRLLNCAAARRGSVGGGLSSVMIIGSGFIFGSRLMLFIRSWRVSGRLLMWFGWYRRCFLILVFCFVCLVLSWLGFMVGLIDGGCLLAARAVLGLFLRVRCC